jgi:hypothetical protein
MGSGMMFVPWKRAPASPLSRCITQKSNQQRIVGNDYGIPGKIGTLGWQYWRKEHEAEVARSRKATFYPFKRMIPQVLSWIRYCGFGIRSHECTGVFFWTGLPTICVMIPNEAVCYFEKPNLGVFVESLEDANGSRSRVLTMERTSP